MISNTESYINRPYFVRPSSIATYLFCSALLSQGGVGTLNADIDINNIGQYHEHSFQSQPKQGQEYVYRLPSSTWISLDNISNIDISDDTVFDASISFDVIRKLSFMSVDEKIDKAIDDYFASKPLKTKTIFKNHRINIG